MVDFTKKAVSDAPHEPVPSFEMAHVLFLDIVAYSLQPLERQTEILQSLQQIVRGTEVFRKARVPDDLISLPTGDGMALVFFHDPTLPVQCALEIDAAVRANGSLKLRMGVHTGPVRRQADIKDNMNVVGGGINMAQRVMDCGDAGHILLSRSIAEVLEQLKDWPESLHDLGMVEVKHGIHVQVYNLYKDGVGNPALPSKVKTQRQPPRRRYVWMWPVLAAAAVVLLGIYLRYAGWLTRPPPPVVPQHTLQYYLLVQKYRDGKPYQEPFRSAGERVFEADYRIRLVVSSPEDIYLYVLNEGPQSRPDHTDFNTLFPSPNTQDGSAHLSPGQQLQLPEGGYFIFDKQKGQEKLWLIWSVAPIPELDALKKWVNRKDLGAIHAPDQLQWIESFLKKNAESKLTVEKDDVKRITSLHGSAPVLVRLLGLEHD